MKKFIFILFACTQLLARTSVSVKEITAVRTKEPITIDGKLSETAWKQKGTDHFTQRDPDEGLPPTQKTIVWCAYDDEALYVAAELHDTAPDSIVSRLGRRDAWIDSDWFDLYIDAYNDGRTGNYFCVNPSGSIQDGILYNDSWRDSDWDGIWHCATDVNGKGWTVEMKIPYSQLRFGEKDEHTWGINCARRIQRRAERDYLVMVPKEERAFVSYFASLKGIKNISPPRRIEVLPYVVASSQHLIHEEDDPFNTGQAFLGNIGADLKLGIGSSLTLDATINPDFGQVEVDPAVMNLSDFETYYSEKRPFFIEGNHIFRFGRGGATNYSSFNFGNPNFFYSRRIGRAPQGFPTHDGFVDMPGQTTILGAGKLSGKIADGWSLGAVSALTSREFARVDSSGIRFREEVEPMTSYNVLRTQKEFNEGRQGLGIIATGLWRNLRTPMLKETLNQQALAGGIDGWTFLDKEKTWVITGWVGASHVQGSPESILSVQESASHYYQRPDADHVTLDSTATSIAGWAGRFYLNKEKGNWRVNAALGIISPGFDTNEMGFQWRGDVINSHILVGYNWYDPDKIFRRKSISAATFRSYDFSGNKIGEGYFLFGHAQFLNYWGLGIFSFIDPPRLSNSATRGGPLMMLPAGGMIDIHINTDGRKPIVFDFGGSTHRNTEGGREWSISTGIEIKPSSRLNISLRPRYSNDNAVAQWVTSQEDPLATDTYGNRVIFANLKQSTFSMSTRINWTFTPKLSFQLYMQPFFSIGHYTGFKELTGPRSFNFHVYGENGSTIEKGDEEYTVDPDGSGAAEPFTLDDPDFNFKSLRGTALLRWEYRPGSVLYVVWTHDRSDSQYPGEFRFHRDIRSLADAESNNIFLVKFTYWLNP